MPAALFSEMKIVLIFISSALIISSLWFYYRFIRRYFTEKSHPIRRILFIPALLHFTFCIMAKCSVLSQVIWRGMIISQILSGASYGLQLYVLLIVLILRLYLIFKDTKFRLSQFTINLYKFLFALTAIMLTFIVPLILTFNSNLIWSIFTLMLIVSIFMNLSLSGMFVYKLVSINNDRIHRIHKDSDHTLLLNIITKNTILTIISNTMTLFVIGGFVLSLLMDDPDDEQYWIFGINVLCQELDCYTNFVCIALSFQCFEKKYQKICGWLDKKFRKCIDHKKDDDFYGDGKDEMTVTTHQLNINSDNEIIDIKIETGTKLMVNTFSVSKTNMMISPSGDVSQIEMKYNDNIQIMGINTDILFNGEGVDTIDTNLTCSKSQHLHFGLCLCIFLCKLLTFIFVLIWLLRMIIINDSND